MKYEEVHKDLFTTDGAYALGHCISRDANMGAGIAREFRRRYPKIHHDVLRQNPHVGDAPVHEGEDGRLIFNLVTKERYWQKPTYDSFTAAIESLKAGVVSRNIRKLAIPLLGAGLDKLSWAKNREIIQDVFDDTDVEILVCRY